jgi:hypothetical protein
MNQVTQATAAGSEETAGASEELTAQSIELRAGVDVLLHLVNGKSYEETRAQHNGDAKGVPLKAEAPPVKTLDLASQRHRPGAVNGNGNGHAHGPANGSLHDDSFFDM